MHFSTNSLLKTNCMKPAININKDVGVFQFFYWYDYNSTLYILLENCRYIKDMKRSAINH